MKSLVNNDDGSDLSQISPVLTCIRSLNESGFLFDEERCKYIKSLSLKQLKNEEISEKDGFWFAVSLRDGTCLYTSEAITNHLGYPQDMLLGQCFMNFLYHKDHLTFANYLTQGLNVCFTQGKRDDSHLVPNTFFCRMRLYQGLKFGYSVANNKPQYKPFKIILHINELILDDICVEKPLATLCVKATATQVLPAYSVPEEIPAMTSFSTRHTASCHFSHVDASAIPYLGFLPQDMIGYSVFDFYHIDDMPQLKEIYELVVKEHGTSFRSKPYRFKVHNGCYIMLETEWSCFINPWSLKLEFVVGQHRVLKGPSDIEIFTPCEMLETNVSDEIFKESQAIQKEIKVILSKSLENFENKRNKRLCSKRKRDLVSFVYNCIDETYKGNKKEQGEKHDMDEGGNNSDPDSVVMGDISPIREADDSSVSSPTVQQMRYQENIERFFASQPKVYSDGSDDFSKNEKSSSVEEYQSSSNGSGHVSGSNNASASTSKDTQPATYDYERKVQESCSNSSKCNMSSLTNGDSGYGKSTSNELTSNQTDPSKQNKMKNICDNSDNNITFASFLALTEETLSAHNKINHKHVKQHRKGTSTFTKPVVSPKDNSLLQQNDIAYSKNKKNSRNHNLGTQTNTLNETCADSLRHQQPQLKQNIENDTKFANNITHSCAHSQKNCLGTLQTPFFLPVVLMGSLPYFQPVLPMSSLYPCTETPSAPTGGFSLPPACAYHLNPMAPSASYPTFPTFFGTPNCNHAIRSSGVTTTSPSTTTTTVNSRTPTIQNSIAERGCSAYSKHKAADKIKTKHPKKQDNSESIESDMQTDESFSSFSKSSQHSQDKDEEMVVDNKKFYAVSNPVALSSDVAYRYQMNVSNIEEVLKKDREVLKMMQQSDLVNKQLQILQKEIKDENESQPITENNFCINEDIMLGFTDEEAVTEELEHREASLLQLMCQEI